MTPRTWMLAAAAAALLLPGLGARDLWAPDEPRYAQLAEELRSFEHGAAGALLLHLEGAPYTQKPPLYFWLAALAGAPGGRVGETAARLPSALAGIAAVWLVAGFGTCLLGRRAGWLGAALLLTSFEFAWLARRAALDVLLTLFEVAALACAWRLREPLAPRRRWLALLHLSLGLAVLTKGPVGWLVPMLVLAVAFAAEGRLRALPGLLPPWALALSLGPGLLWLGAATALAPAGFFAEAVGENLFGRFFAGTSHPRPAWYYLAALPADALPWTLLWPALAWMASRGAYADPEDPRTPARRFLLIWVAVTLAFFSLSSGKRGLYLLPCFPALTLLCADAVLRFRRERGGWPRWASGLGLALLGTAAAAGPLARRAAADHGLDVPIGLAAAPAGLAALAAALGRRALRTGSPPPAAVAVAVAAVLALELWAFTGLLPRLDPEKSPRPIATAAAARTPPGEPVGLAGKRSLIGGLAYYGGRPVVYLDSPAAVERFFAGGGRALVVPEKDLARFAPGGVRVVERVRHGRRALVVVSPAAPPRGAAQEPRPGPAGRQVPPLRAPVAASISRFAPARAPAGR